MKEYKTIIPKLGVLNRVEKLETLLNQYAREGWQFKYISESYTLLIFEREKNR